VICCTSQHRNLICVTFIRKSRHIWRKNASAFILLNRIMLVLLSYFPFQIESISSIKAMLVQLWFYPGSSLYVLRKPRKTSVRIGSVLAGIWINKSPNTNCKALMPWPTLQLCELHGKQNMQLSKWRWPRDSQMSAEIEHRGYYY
jgi:hypothetical protein